MYKAFLFFRSILFYAGYVVVTIGMSALFIVCFAFLSQRNRYRFASTWCMTILNWLRLCCGVEYEIIGLEHIPSRAAVFLSNHQSSWETILFYKLIYPLSPILKKELLNIPFWGWALRLTKPIAIDRSKPREAGKSLLTQGVQRLGEGNSLIVFPEGTRSSPDRLKKFSRSGATLAIAADAPVIPIAHNAGYAWPPRTFIKYPGKVTVEFGAAIDADNLTDLELTQKAEDWIRSHIVKRP